jgi:hypothetical protein
MLNSLCVAVCFAGWFEYVYDWFDPLEGPMPITEFDAEGKHVIDPYTYSLKFYKPAHGSY